MQKILVILGFIFVAFILEFLLYNIVGPWIVPNFFLLLIMFADLYWGIRYGILTAVTYSPI